MPMPKFTWNPSLISFAARLAILWRVAWAAAFSGDNAGWEDVDDCERVANSILFSTVAGTILST